MNRALRVALLVVVASSATCAFVGCKNRDEQTATPSAEEKDAVTAAEAWLALVDGEKYADSWDRAASLFKDKVASEQWQSQVAGVRKPLGAVLSRKIQSTHFTTTLPGAPDGKYVVIQYETSFANKASAVETVTPMADTDGQWRVSGYYVR